MLSDQPVSKSKVLFEKHFGQQLLAIPGAKDEDGNRTKYVWLHSARNENQEDENESDMKGLADAIFRFVNFCDSFPPLTDDEIFKEHFLNGPSRDYIYSSGISLLRSDAYSAFFTFFRQLKDTAREEIEKISASKENDLLVKHYEARIDTLAFSSDSRVQRLLTLCLLPLNFRNYFREVSKEARENDLEDLHIRFVRDLAAALTIELSEDKEQIAEDSLFDRDESFKGFNEMHNLIKDTLNEKFQLNDLIFNREGIQTLWIDTLRELSKNPILAKLSSKLNIIADNIQPFFSQLPQS